MLIVIFIKNFTDIKDPGLHKDSNNLLHIDITNNLSNIVFDDSTKYNIFDIFICFPSIHTLKDNKHLLKYDGEIVLIFKSDTNKYMALSSLLKIGSDSDSSTLCSKALFAINSYICSTFSTKADDNAICDDSSRL